MKKYRITLEAEEREQLQEMLSKGKADVRRLKHAQILLAADESADSPAQIDTAIAKALPVGTATIERVRRRFVEEGLEMALSPCKTPKRRYKTKLDGRQEAKRIAGRLEIHHTPKHGSWLNMAEIELSALGRQRLGRRIGKQATLASSIRAWENARNATTRKVKWQFTTADARIKLPRLYPSIDD